MARKTPADKAGAQAPAATAEQQGDLQAGITTTDASAAVPAAPGSTEQTTEAPGADAALKAGDTAESNTGQDAHLIQEGQGDSARLALAAGAPAAPGAAAGDSVDDPADSDLDDGEIEGLWITAIPEQGFRRCGYRFTREGFGIALSALTEQQIEQLESEPNLKVERGVFSGDLSGLVS